MNPNTPENPSSPVDPTASQSDPFDQSSMAPPPPGGTSFPPVETAEAAAPASRPNVARYAAVFAVVAVLAVGAIAFMAMRGGSAAISAGSPIDAVQNMIKVIDEGRVVDVIRSEFPWIDELGGVDQASFSAMGLPEGRIDGITFEGKDLTFEVEEVGDSLAVVAITGGAFRVGFDMSKLPASFRAAIPGPGGDAAFQQTLPVAPLAQGACQNPEGTNCRPDALQLVTVNDGAGWRVSLLHSVIYLTTDSTLEPRTIGGSDSPEAVVLNLEAAAAAEDVNGLLDLLDPVEFSWLSDFRMEPEDDDTEGVLDLEATAIDVTPSSAMLHVDSLEVRTRSPGADEETFVFDGDCAFTDGEKDMCLSELAAQDLGPFGAFKPVLEMLSNDGVNLGLVQRDSRWYLSLTKTLEPFTPALTAASQDLQRLAETCRSAMQSAGGTFEGVPEECLALLGPFGLLGGVQGYSSESSSSFEELDPDEFQY